MNKQSEQPHNTWHRKFWFHSYLVSYRVTGIAEPSETDYDEIESKLATELMRSEEFGEVDDDSEQHLDPRRGLRQKGETKMEYHERVRLDDKLHELYRHELLKMADCLCPENWVLQISADRTCSVRYNYMTHQFSEPFRYEICVHNGLGDNVTVGGKTVEGACARLVAALLDGGIFPLGGGGQHFCRTIATKSDA